MEMEKMLSLETCVSTLANDLAPSKPALAKSPLDTI
jgi:hypothetical protein